MIHARRVPRKPRNHTCVDRAPLQEPKTHTASPLPISPRKKVVGESGFTFPVQLAWRRTDSCNFYRFGYKTFASCRTREAARCGIGFALDWVFSLNPLDRSTSFAGSLAELANANRCCFIVNANQVLLHSQRQPGAASCVRNREKDQRRRDFRVRPSTSRTSRNGSNASGICSGVSIIVAATRLTVSR
jgi:hypothetical protein